MKSTLKKITASALIVLTVLSSTQFFSPKPVEAQAGKATACAAGYIGAGIAGLSAVAQNVVGVSKSSFGDSATAYLDNAGLIGISFNDCILMPLAKIMIITIIRNIGASVVDWVNKGFEGKPSFVTDFGGTLLDSADETIGQFIEGSDLAFMCNSFSFQIRIALALKYSQPFREKARCTLTKAINNTNAFIDNNGGAGWDNWLRLTTEPQNNVYGAFVVADTELARRVSTAVTTKKDRIALGQGFLDYETCDEWENEIERRKRETAAEEVFNNNTVFGSVQSSFATTSTSGYDTAPTASQKKFVDPTGANRTCVKKSTKTPGKIIASKLESEFAKGDIQQAVATEIDDVIAATMNQLAQKMIQGASGLLGLSQRKNTSNRESYLQKYQNQFYGGTTPTEIDAGATSDIDDYTIANFDEASRLIQSNGLVQEIYDSTDAAAASAVAANRAQQQAFNDVSGASERAEINVAFYKPTSQSSNGAGPSSKANDGVKDGAVSQYNQVAATGEEQNAWWEVDLEEPENIKEVRIWRVTNKPVNQTLETFRVIATNDNGSDAWTSEPITPTESAFNPITVQINQSRRYVRIQKQSTLDQQCRVIPAEYRGGQESEACYRPLELAEVEIISVVDRPTIGGLSTSTRPGGSSGTATVETAKTISLTSSSTNPLRASPGTPFSYDVQVSANHSTSSLIIETTFKKNGSATAIGNVFSSLVVTTKRGSNSAINVIGLTSPGIKSRNVSVSARDNFVFSFSGEVKNNAVAGTYVIESILTDVYGRVIQTRSTEFVVQ